MKLFQFEREPFKNLRATEKMALKQTRKKGVQIGSNSKNKLEQEKGTSASLLTPGVDLINISNSS